MSDLGESESIPKPRSIVDVPADAVEGYLGESLDLERTGFHMIVSSHLRTVYEGMLRILPGEHQLSTNIHDTDGTVHQDIVPNELEIEPAEVSGTFLVRHKNGLWAGAITVTAAAIISGAAYIRFRRKSEA